jgi:hypothetical protein
MKTLRRLSRLFLPSGDLRVKPTNGGGGAPEPQHVVEPVNRPLRTQDGWPMGERQFPTRTWQMIISLEAYTRLMTWSAGSRGLELSGFALLTERPQAKLDQDKIFYVDDILLVCDIQESSGGYTEMTAEQRVQGMMWARSLGRSANQLVWVHTHPVTGWSGTDVNTLRQRVHETGLQEVLSTFAFVLTPRGIRARWDQSGPKEADNIYVDEIPVMVGDPSILDVIREAQAEVAELLAQRAPSKQTPKTIPMPTPSWQRPRIAWRTDYGLLRQPSFWEDEDWWKEIEELYELAYLEVTANAVREALGPNEDHDEYFCRRDPATLVNTRVCAECPFVAGCFKLDQGELDMQAEALLEGVEE